MTGDNTPPHEERIDPREGAVDAARVEELLETLQATADSEANAIPGDQGPQASPSPVEEPGEPLGQLEAELAALRSENESLRGQYMRIAADFDNFRKRQSRDKEDQRLHITCTTLTEILPVVDNFDRARQQLNPQSEEAQTLHRSYQNLYKQLVDVFKQLGVSPMRVEGEPFDPTLHEAVMREPSQEHPEDVVIEELQRGYHLDGRVLRHALVKVSMGPGPAGGASPGEVSAPPSEGPSD
ncbi:nucleotide exchange factor GrpE [Synechococcus sp. CS-1332]|uniref:nucleotide exchange factor GrpE n=1 Tax=Synechococcus sp. CS-1332 TaxID=2847972 RepID=UPI00223C251B|nr:nucleotide exchange factor GrpE [Synechococcus sp. CS-1332]MCT0208972.1 nucleotide exchange factor GrpE [Synechococcus sp. CS-1332]